MIRIEVIVSPVLAQQGEQIRSSPKLMETAMRRASTRLRSRILKDARQQPNRPRYPIRWQSDKQRRAFFASRGFGNGIPYARTGGLARSMDVVVSVDPAGGTITLSNSAAAAPFVVGTRQQIFHRDTGWRTLEAIGKAHQEEAQTVVQQTWFTVSDPTAGVR